MTAPAYYSDADAWCCDVLRDLIDRGELPDGFVDNRDIRLVQPHELEGYGQIHLFAGMGGGPLACRIAGLPDDFGIITAGVPCQPASQAGSRLGDADERWLWPEFFRLLRHLRSRYALVEQPPGIVSLHDGREWNWILGELAEIVSDFEVARVSAADVGAPQERERVWIVAFPEMADNDEQRRCAIGESERSQLEGASRGVAARCDEGMVDAASGGRRARSGEPVRRVSGGCARVDDAESIGRRSEQSTRSERIGRPGPTGAIDRVGEPGCGRVQSVDDARDASIGDGEDEGEGLQRERRRRDVRDYGQLLRPWSDAVPVRGADGTVRLIPREAAEAGPEPSVRSLVDGLSYQLVGLLPNREAEEEVDGPTRETTRAEAMRTLWGENGAHADAEWSARGRVCVCAEKILLAVVCEHARGRDAQRSQAASVEAPERRLRELWCDDGARCASHRRGCVERLAGELSDRVSHIPNALASRAAEVWRDYARARPSLWPVTDGALGRVARLRAIGNAWCPQAALPALGVIIEHARNQGYESIQTAEIGRQRVTQEAI
jgi:site-specific DNA-cytosine methylase